MKIHQLSRRDSLFQCAAIGALRIAPWLGLTAAVGTLDAQEQTAPRKPTPWNEIGPFYKRLAPNHAQLRSADEPGLPLAVSGSVFGTRGDSLPGAKIEIWQADHRGLYDLDGYRFRATLEADLSRALAERDEAALDALAGREPLDDRDEVMTLLAIYDLWTAPLWVTGGAEDFQSYPAVAASAHASK